MIRFENDGRLFCPVFYCDICDRRIYDTEDGNVLYKPTDTLDDGIAIVHKKCNYLFDHSYQEELGRWHWEDLGVFLIQLGYNSQLWNMPEAEMMVIDEGRRGRDRQKRVKLPRSKKVGMLAGRFAILKRDGYRCQLCGRTAKDGVKLEVDHKIPRAKGGPDTPENKWTLCFDCNRGKRTELLGWGYA